MKVNYLGTQYVHKFTNADGEVKYVTCSNEDFDKITEKPFLEGYEYSYSVGGMLKVDSESGLLEDGQTTEVDGVIISRNWEDNGEVKTE